MDIQIGLFEAILDILYLKPLFMIGLVVTGLPLYWLFTKNKQLPRFRIAISSILMYYFLCIVLKNIVGIPTIYEFIRLTKLGESVFNPNLNLIPLVSGLSLEFLLNILCFIPFGFLCPAISGTYEKLFKVVLLGLGLSLIIEISQLFTLYRATDINDLISNVIGTIVGFLLYKLFVKLRILKSNNDNQRVYQRNRSTWFLPILIVISACVVTFLS